MGSIVLNSDQSYTCGECGIIFGNYPGARVHSRIHTSSSVVTERERPPEHAREAVREFILNIDCRWSEARRTLIAHGATHAEITQIEAEMISMAKVPT